MADTASSAGSTFSSLSVFNKAEAQKARFEIVVEGSLDIMLQNLQKKKNNFETCYCRLTRDGRLQVDHEGGKNSGYIVEECAVSDDETVFRLTVLIETDLKAAATELLCRADNDMDAAKWLVGIECALRTRLQQFQNEMDCARGKLGIVEIEKKGATPNLNNIKWYQCFYYQNTFRVRGLDGPQTSTLEVVNITTDQIQYPLCMFIDVRGRTLVCKAEDPDQFRRWTLAIEKDRHDDTQTLGSIPDILEGDLLIGPSDDKLIRVKAKYYKSQRLLETTDFAGVVDSFNVARCSVAAPFYAKKYHFTLDAKMPDFPGENEMILYVQCPDEDSKRRWVKAFSIPLKTLQMLMKAAIKEIDLRRIFHKEGSSKDKRRNVEFEDIHELACMTTSEADAALNNKEDWTVSKLERLNQVILKMLPEPIMPFDKQDEVITLGAQIIKASNQDKYIS